MKTYTGKSGRQYAFTLNLGLVRRLAREANIDILSPEIGARISGMGFVSDLALRVALLTVPPAEHVKYTFDFDAEFSDMAALKSLAGAVAEELSNFTRSLGLNQAEAKAETQMPASPGAGDIVTNSPPSQG